MTCADHSAMIFVGAATEVETLRKALAEAKEKAAKEQAAYEKHEARVGEVQQELQDAVRNASPWSATLQIKRPNSPRLARVHKRPGLKPRAPSRKSRRPRRSRRVRLSLCKASM